jgi:hypothetical protein
MKYTICLIFQFFNIKITTNITKYNKMIKLIKLDAIKNHDILYNIIMNCSIFIS